MAAVCAINVSNRALAVANKAFTLTTAFSVRIKFLLLFRVATTLEAAVIILASALLIVAALVVTATTSLAIDLATEATIMLVAATIINFTFVVVIVLTVL